MIETMGLAKKIDHIAIAVKDLDAAVKTFTDNFGFPVGSSGTVPPLNMRRAFLSVGDASLELFQPTSDQHPGAKFLADRGEGMYLLSLEVDDLAAATGALAERGVKVSTQSIDSGIKLGFISPKHTHGVLLQLIEHPRVKRDDG
ncbi:MAG: VOC family protein [Candidatus Binatia bacterium]